MQGFYTNLVLDGDNPGAYHFGMSLMRKLRNAKGLSQGELAELSGTSQPQIRRLENDERELTGTWAIRIAPHLDIHPEELVFGNRTVRIVGYVGAASKAHFQNGDDGFLGLARPPRGATERTVAVEIRGDSLGAAFDGWVIYYDDRREPPTPDLIGKLCIVGLGDDQVLVKRLRTARTAGLYDLWPGGGGDPIENQAVEWADAVMLMASPDQAKIEESQAEPAPEPKPSASSRRKKTPVARAHK
jgi:transcriptional regulator with XRE-family HTH domain